MRNEGMKLPELPKPPELSKILPTEAGMGTGPEDFFGDLLPVFPTEGPPLPRVFGMKWPWVE